MIAAVGNVEISGSVDRQAGRVVEFGLIRFAALVIESCRTGAPIGIACDCRDNAIAPDVADPPIGGVQA